LIFVFIIVQPIAAKSSKVGDTTIARPLEVTDQAAILRAGD
jgi:hypothetical protein